MGSLLDQIPLFFTADNMPDAAGSGVDGRWV